MHTNRFWELMAKQLSGELTQAELQELNYLKGEDEYAAFNEDLLQSVSAISLHPKNEITGSYTNERWDALQQKVNLNPNETTGVPAPYIFKKIFKYIAVAASLVLIISVGWKYLHSTQPESSSLPNIVSTRYGSKTTKIQMPDSTQVWLNAGSSLKYNNDTYGQTLREVDLTGEAYFDVVKDESHPFIIHTKTIDIKVLGTAFNIRAYPNEKQTETALIRGSIEISFPGRPSEKLFLKPNEKITVANNNNAVSKLITAPQPSAGSPIIVLSTITFEPADSAVIETSWTRNKLIFRSKNFQELAQDMERWYNVSIRFGDSSLMQRRLTGTFQNETVLEALDYLKLSSPFQYHFTKETNTITLYL